MRAKRWRSINFSSTSTKDKMQRYICVTLATLTPAWSRSACRSTKADYTAGQYEDGKAGNMGEAAGCLLQH